MKHPYSKVINKEIVKYPVYHTSVGAFGCGPESDLNELGLGMVVYFKIIKTFAIVFFLIMLFNIPLYYVYTTNHSEKSIINYKEAFFKTTLGNIGSSKNSLNHSNIQLS